MKKHTFLVSDESLNSHGFKVLTAGINTTNFEKNPVMLYMHDRSHSVIGRWENLRKEGNKLYADAIFDEEDPEAVKIAGKVERGFIKAASVGILAIEHTSNDVVSKSELVEISIVDVGSNRNALRLYHNSQEVKELYHQLNITNMDLLQSLIILLGLPKDTTEEDILKKVAQLKKLESSNQEEEKQKKEELLTLSLQKGKIEAPMIPQYRKMLDFDFEGTKKILDGMPEKIDLAGMIVAPGTIQKGSEKHPKDKPKNQWNLHDYRKYAPNELRDNPELYKTLVNREYNQ